MAKRSSIARFLVTATSFAGGIALGMLLSPKSGRENRKWIHQHSTDLSGWIDDQRKQLMRSSEDRLTQVRNKVHQGIKNNVPDLYDATEEIHLDDSPVIGV